MTTIKKRLWIKSGNVEELDAKQQRLLELVLEKIRFYYREIYRTRSCYQYPLSLSRLMRLCKRNSYAITLAVKILANTIPDDNKEGLPPIYYTRVSSEKN